MQFVVRVWDIVDSIDDIFFCFVWVLCCYNSGFGSFVIEVDGKIFYCGNFIFWEVYFEKVVSCCFCCFQGFGFEFFWVLKYFFSYYGFDFLKVFF